jgi:glycosyltransferase involved in cell wall biosynthesis
MVVFSHPTGNANARAAAEALAEARMLTAFYTSIACFRGSALDWLGKLPPFASFRRRQFAPELRAFTRPVPWSEVGRLAAQRMGFERLYQHETGRFCVDRVYQEVDQRVAAAVRKAARAPHGAVYGYEDGAATSFRAAKSAGIPCLYDLPIGYWRTARRLMEAERERRPEWSSTLTGLLDSPHKLARKDEELRLADHIFVASRFTAQTLQEAPQPLAPIHVIPYGFPPVAAERSYTSVGGRTLRVLFVGGLSQRKGLAYLFEALEPLKAHIELTLVGQKAGGDCPALHAALAQHRWIPTLPHEQVLRLMQTQDVLVFPSLFEGFGLVITEAMSQGTPVITTERTAGPDLIEHDQNGWLVPAGDALALRQQLETILTKPARVTKAGQAARQTALQRPWSVYGHELTQTIRNVLAS